MDIFSSISELRNMLQSLRNQGKTIGFVPTMGALHHGHISLLERAKRENDVTVCSIFVNPLQFNDKKDLEKYPRTLEEDIHKLTSSHCNYLFSPSSEDIYSTPESKKIILNLGLLDKVMEGAHRPGHFEGVCVVVKNLFEIVTPNKAYFGEKDFQQLAIIKYMVKTLKLPVEIIGCPTIRESDGLAMSSRNALLNTDERKNAAHIAQTLFEAKKHGKEKTIDEFKKWTTSRINENPFLTTEYFEIINSETLQPVSSWTNASNVRICVAVKIGSIRLIDNIALT